MTNMKNSSRRLSEATYLKVRIIILQCKQFVIIMKYPIDLAQKEVLAFLLNENGAIEFPEIGTVYLGAPERLVDDSRLPEAVLQHKRMVIAS